MTKTFCDVCGKEIADVPTTLHVYLYQHDSTKIFHVVTCELCVKEVGRRLLVVFPLASDMKDWD
jgi:hypothetical protein